MSSLDYLDLCRLCLVKDRVSVPIFDGEGDVRQIFLKIAACLPVKVAREDKLPKKICDDCVYKVELFYQFWNTTANAEKQLLQWLGDVGLEEKQGYTSEVLNSELMKQEESENRLDVSVMQTTGEHQNNMAMNMMDDINLGIPIIMSTDQQITVPISSSNNVQNVQSVPGPSTRSTHNQVAEKNTTHDAEEDTSDDDNTDDECDVDDGLPVKEEIEDAASANRAIEPTTFVNVALTCDEAGPSGLQQQKLVEMPGMGMQQTSEGDSKSGSDPLDPTSRDYLSVKLGNDYFRIPKSLAMFMTKESRSDKRRKIIKNSLKKNKTNGMKKATVEEDKNIIVINSSSSCDELSEDDKPLAERLDELTMITLRSSRLKNKLHTCHICHVIFNHKSNLTRHMIKHNNLRPHRCDVCSKYFKTHTYMMRHMEIHYEPQHAYKCRICNFKARYRSYLKIHYIRRHTNEYKFSCEQCGKLFKLKSDRTIHMRCHEMESCVCDICGSSYPNKNALYHHRQYRHSTSKKAYQCKTCKKRFSTMKNLKNHENLHNMKYVCEQCGMEFKRRYGLIRHMRTHSTEKKCLCAICGKTFKSLSAQKVHLLTHVGERPYICDVCGKSFTQRSPMMLHRRTKHPEVLDAPPPIKITNLLHGVKDKIITNKISN